MPELWDADYEAVRLLKEDGSRRTYLLEKRGEPWRRYIWKQAAGADAVSVRREHEILKAISGPGMTLELRESGGVCGLLRDYLPGTTLEQLIQRDGALTGPETARLGIGLCDALGTLHAMTPPVIHRDLKPENILLTETGRCRLIDFGAARTYKTGQREDTVCLGTRGYAAPEQYGSGQTDVRTDVFGLGKVLTYALAGGYTDTPPRLAGRDRFLERILGRCCAYDPARRWPDTGKLKRALERYLSLRALPVRGLTLAACAAALLCAGALAGGYELGHRAPAAAPAAETLSGWDSFRWKPNVTEIIRLAEEQDWPGLAKACEELVSALEADPVIRSTEPAAFWEMDESELAEYYVTRQGYEYIADNLAYGDGLAVRRLDAYEAAMPVFAMHLQSHVDYVLTDDGGNVRSSALHMLVVEGDDRNIDGCVIEILGALDRALEQTPAP